MTETGIENENAVTFSLAPPLSPNGERESPPLPGPRQAAINKPRIGFLGVGWIGRNRLEAIANTNAVELTAIADPAEELRRKAGKVAPEAALVENFEELMELGLDGVVVATPSALHAEQASVALERGLAVFCQKPLGRTAPETARVVRAARAADRLPDVGLSHPRIERARLIRELVRLRELGQSLT